MANAYISKRIENLSSKEATNTFNDDRNDSLDLVVGGMTCSHCKESVESSIKSINEDVETSIDIATGKVVVLGSDLDAVAIKEKIKGRGFTVES